MGIMLAASNLKRTAPHKGAFTCQVAYRQMIVLQMESFCNRNDTGFNQLLTL